MWKNIIRPEYNDSEASGSIDMKTCHLGKQNIANVIGKFSKLNVWTKSYTKAYVYCTKPCHLAYVVSMLTIRTGRDSQRKKN